MTTTKRQRQISELIHRELAVLILRELSDPLFKQLSITAVEVSPDMAIAKIFVSVFDENKADVTIAALTHQGKNLRHLLAKNLNLRITPRLIFYYDNSVIYGQKLSKIIDDAVSDDE